ncbi:hypothetical protein HC891_04960 [Candidatus Gracilibacteria bacterium]|nr:hypothetical protein [Candidatus Gracilibacteria bacterium]
MAGGTQELQQLGHEGGGLYTIEVQGEVERHWEQELNMRLTYRQTEYGTVSVLSGQLADQSAMLGTLGRLAMWGYVILLVRFAPEASLHDS